MCAQPRFCARFAAGAPLRAVLIVIALLLCGTTIRAASPVLSEIAPHGGERGTELDVSFTGARLEDPLEVLMHTPGIEATEVKFVDAKRVKVHFKIAADAPIGQHMMRLRTASGISELRTFWVGPYPVVTEIEDKKTKNNDFDHAQSIQLNFTVAGLISSEDVDNFVVEAKKGQRLSVEVIGLRIGLTLFDPRLAIFDSNRKQIALCDDTALCKQDPFISIVVPEDGKYFIQLREAANGGDGGCHYLMHVGTFPRPHVLYPSGGKSDEAMDVQFLGDPLGPTTRPVKLSATLPSPVDIIAEQGGQFSPSPNFFRVCPFPNVLEVEPDNDVKTATPASGELPVAFNGIISEKGDVDFFRFNAKKGQQLDVTVFARRLGSPLDSVLVIYDKDGKGLASNDDAENSPDSYLRFAVPADGEYLISVRDQLNQGGPDFVYRVEVVPVKPLITLRLPVFNPNVMQERTTLAIPRGNRTTTMLRVLRSDVAGELVLDAADLPPGVTMKAGPIHEGVEEVPVVFEAAPDAPIEGRLSTFKARSIDDKIKFETRFVHVIDMILGYPNNYSYYHPEVDRLAVGVANEAPFSIEVVEPKVPVVHDGSMNLKVIAKRKEGFKQPISVRTLFRPPGLGGQSTMEIPADKDEILFPIAANDKAPAKKYKMALQAMADINGPLWTSSQLFDLEIAPAYVHGKLEMTAAEQGQIAQVVCKLDQKLPFEGTAQIALLGLPPNTTAAEKPFTSADKKITFEVQTTDKSPLAQHNSLFCRVTITKNGEPIVSDIARGGVLRIDPPVKRTTAPTVAQGSPTTAPTKDLTRLERLRLEQESKEAQP